MRSRPLAVRAPFMPFSFSATVATVREPRIARAAGFGSVTAIERLDRPATRYRLVPAADEPTFTEAVPVQAFAVRHLTLTTTRRPFRRSCVLDSATDVFSFRGARSTVRQPPP